MGLLGVEPFCVWVVPKKKVVPFWVVEPNPPAEADAPPPAAPNEKLPWVVCVDEFCLMSDCCDDDCDDDDCWPCASNADRNTRALAASDT